MRTGFRERVGAAETIWLRRICDPRRAGPGRSADSEHYNESSAGCDAVVERIGVKLRAFLRKLRLPLAAAALATAIVAWLCVAPARAVQAGRPNIIFVLADDLGVNDLGAYGRRDHRTPHLDRLASEGLRFTTAYVGSPICSPSRASIMTGRHPARLHLTTYIPGRPDAPSQRLLHPTMRQQLPLEETTLAERLRAAGYATAAIGKWHLGGAGFSPREQGFDVAHAGQATTVASETEGGKGEYDLTREATRFIDANRDRPFFLYLAHNNPHIPYRPPGRR